MSGKSVLLYIDDEPALLEIGRIYLEMGTEFVVDVASSAPEALSLINVKAYDAIISDYQMPGMNGIELLKRVRSVGNQIPFIIFTGKGREEVAIEALNNGADFYLQKGGNPKTLYTELIHFIRQSIQMRQMQLNFDEQQQRIHDLQNATDMIQSVGPDGQFFYVNRRWLDILGYHEADLSKLNLFDIIHEDSLQHCMETFQRVMAGESVGLVDAIFKTSDGNRVFVEGFVDCKLVDGKPQYTRGIFKDVTEQKMAEFELQKKNRELNVAYGKLHAAHKELSANGEKFRALVENSLDGILITDLQGNLLFLNRTAGTLVDLEDYHGVIGSRNVIEFIAPESQADVFKDFSRVAAGCDSYIANYKLITDKKQEVWVESIGKRILFDNSDAILISIKDITERKISESRLRESEKKFSSIFQNNPVPLALVSAITTKYVDINDAFTRNTGYTHDEVIGRTAEDIRIFVDEIQYDRYTSLLQEKGIVQDMEMQCRVKSGEIRTCLFSTNCVFMDGEPFFVSTIEDITEDKRNEQAIQALVRSMVDTSGLQSLKRINENIGSWLGADCVMIGEICPDGDSVTVLSMMLDGEVVFDFSYTLKGTPCEDVREKGFCMYSDNVINLFPGSKDLVDLNIKGYVGTPLRNAEGDVIGIICALSRRPLVTTPAIQEIMDVVAVKAAMEIERIRMDRVLHDNERKLAEAMDMANLANWEFDLRTETFTFNDRFYSLYSTTAEREGGYQMSADRYASEFIPSDERAIVLEEMKKGILAINPHYLSECEHRIIRRDGAIRYIAVRICIIKDAEGGIIKSHGANQDITERKEAEIGVKKINKKLSLLSGITRHDINNQLQILYGYVTIVQDMISDPSYESRFLGITNAINRINAMISFTKEYEQIGVEASTWQRMDQVIVGAASNAIPGAIQLQNELPEKLEIFADPLVTKVFFNLIDNSLRHGGEVTTIRLSLDLGDDTAIIVYEDDGRGIQDYYRERIFEKGFGTNTGYGLALSREILDITGITIVENGVAGKGARFEISVPMAYFRLS